MRNYDEMSTGAFWADREARLAREAKEDADYADSVLGRMEAARQCISFLGAQKIDRYLTPAEEQEYDAARKLIDQAARK